METNANDISRTACAIHKKIRDFWHKHLNVFSKPIFEKQPFARHQYCYIVLSMVPNQYPWTYKDFHSSLSRSCTADLVSYMRYQIYKLKIGLHGHFYPSPYTYNFSKRWQIFVHAQMYNKRPGPSSLYQM